jgi:hypothetical protein
LSDRLGFEFDSRMIFLNSWPREEVARQGQAVNPKLRLGVRIFAAKECFGRKEAMNYWSLSIYQTQL